MATRITAKGQVILPKKARQALCVVPGDSVEFTVDDSGTVIVCKTAPAAASASAAMRRERQAHPRLEAQRRARAAELAALLRGLD